MDHLTTVTKTKFVPIVINQRKAQEHIEENSVLIRLAIALLAKTETELAKSVSTDEGEKVSIEVVKDFFGCLEWLDTVKDTVEAAQARLIYCLDPNGSNAPTKPQPDQLLFDACALWRERMDALQPLYSREASDEETQPFFDKLCEAEELIADTPATTLEGLAAKARHILGNDPDDLLADEYAPQRLIKNLVREVAALHGPAVFHAIHPDQAIIDLCKRCSEALAANEAIYHRAPEGNIPDDIGEEAEAHYQNVIVPLLNEIEKKPATTITGLVAKARIFMSDSVQFSGEPHMDSACIQMLNDLSAMDLAPEVPEAPHYEAKKQFTTLEAA